MSQGSARSPLVGPLLDLVLVVVGVVVLGLAVGVAWPHLVDPALSQRTAQGISTDEVQLARIFSADGWFVVLGFSGSLLLGALLMLRRRGHEVAVLLLLLAGTYLSAWRIAEPLGKAIGPPDPVSVLTSAKVGATAPVQVRVTSDADRLSWPLGAALGSLVVLLGVNRLESRERHRSEGHDGFVAEQDAAAPSAD